MSKFTEALNSPLPSKVNTDNIVTESEELENVDTEQDVDTEGCEGNEGVGCEDTECDNDDIEDITDDEGFDPDNLSDEELASLDAELGNQAMDTVVGDEAEVNLSPEEEIEADDMMSVAATTMLVRDELNVEERVNFVQNEGRTAVNEGFMTESDINELANELGLVQEAKYTNKMIIRLDAESKKKQLYALAVNVSAAAHNDPDYIKLKKVMKMRKVLRARLEKKYHSEAMKRMRVYYARLKRSKSESLSKVGNKYSK